MSFELRQNSPHYKLLEQGASHVRIVRLLLHYVNRFLDPNCEEWCVKNVAVQKFERESNLIVISWGFIPLYRSKEKSTGCIFHQYKAIVVKLFANQYNYQIAENLRKFMRTTISVNLVSGSVQLHNSSNVVSIPVYTGIPFIYNLTKLLTISSTDIARTYLLNEANDFVSQDYWIANLNNDQLYGLVPTNGVALKCYSMSLRLALSREVVLYPLEVNVLSQSEAKLELTHFINMRLRYLPVKDAPHNGTTPLAELRHRWRHVAALDEYLRSDCGTQCGMDVIILRVDATADPWEYYLVWTVRSLTSMGDMESPFFKKELGDSLRREKRYSRNPTELCPVESLKDLARMLYANDASRESKSLGNPRLSQILRAKDVAILKEVHLMASGVCQDVDLMKLNIFPSSEKQTGNVSQLGIGLKRPPNLPGNDDYLYYAEEERHRVFLFTTVLPTCLMVVLALLVALLVTCYLQSRSERQRRPHRRKGAPIIFNGELENCRLPPSRPLILAHERPPVTPPYYLDEESTPLSVPSLPGVHGPILHYNQHHDQQHELERHSQDLPLSHTSAEIYQFTTNRVMSPHPHHEMTSPYLYSHSPRIMTPMSHSQANL